MRLFIIVVTVFFSLGILSAEVSAKGFYKWKDARGNIQYGDEPPANAKAKKLKLPEIMVLDGFGKQWESSPYKALAPTNTKPSFKRLAPAPAASQPVVKYSTLAFIAPKAGQLIQAENGDVSAMLSLKPPLKRGHKLLYLVDGKVLVKSQSRIANFPGLSNGSHTLSVNIANGRGKVFQRSNTINFRVMR